MGLVAHFSFPKQSLANRRDLSDIRNSRIPNITLRWTSNPKTCWYC